MAIRLLCVEQDLCIAAEDLSYEPCKITYRNLLVRAYVQRIGLWMMLKSQQHTLHDILDKYERPRLSPCAIYLKRVLSPQQPNDQGRYDMSIRQGKVVPR